MKLFTEWGGCLGGVVSRAANSLSDCSVLRQLLGNEEYERIMRGEQNVPEEVLDNGMVNEGVLAPYTHAACAFDEEGKMCAYTLARGAEQAMSYCDAAKGVEGNAYSWKPKPFKEVYATMTLVSDNFDENGNRKEEEKKD